MMFEQILDFLRIHWKDILYLIISLILVIITLVRRKIILKNDVNQIDKIESAILYSLPACINAVEIDGHGEEKKEAVVEACLQFIKEEFSVQDPSIFASFISKNIEKILSTPQRKEIKDEEKSKQVRR